MTLQADAAAFVSTLTFDDLPQDAVRVATLGFTDTIAALLAGRVESVTRATEKYLAQTATPGGPVVTRALLGASEYQAEHSALLDAVAAHALDYDDYAFANHPSSIMVPAILAAAQIVGSDGPAMITAYAAGYEVWAEVMAREPDHLHSKGWHPTATFGPLGAAAAVASLLGLSATETSHALGLATSYGGGVMENFGSMTKPYHAGRAAEAGMRCCFLAQSGMTASPTAIEGPKGLLAALSPDRNADLTRKAKFGTFWHIGKSGLNIKKYPTIGASQRIIDGILGLSGRDDFDLDAIKTIRPRVSEKYAMLMNNPDPSSASEAKFSLAYACAAALRFGTVSLATLSDDALADPLLRSLISKVEVDAVDEYDPDYPIPAPYDMTTVVFNDGTEVQTEKVRRATGHTDLPLTSEQLEAKFMDCSRFGRLEDILAVELFAKLQSLPDLININDLMVVQR